MLSPTLKVLHLFSNSKWTGPAEPVVNTCRALRSLGVDVTFACSPKAGSGFNKVRHMAELYKIPVLTFMYLSKHRHPWKNFRDKTALRRHLQEVPYALVHCHLHNDHLIAGAALAESSIPLVRSSYEGVGLSESKNCRALLKRTNLIIEPSEMAKNADLKHFTLPAERFSVIPGAIDLTRFSPSEKLPSWRDKWKLTKDHFIFGIVARMQTHRHYEDLFVAFAHVLRQFLQARLLIVGRGTHQEKVAYAPVRNLKLEGKVIFTGYLEGDEYTGALGAMDVGIYLTPGSDGTCRTVREFMAMGVPVISSARGMLPELLGQEERGLVTDGSPEGLTEAMVRMITHKALVKRCSEAALAHAQKHFDLNIYGARILAAYHQLLRLPG